MKILDEVKKQTLFDDIVLQIQQLIQSGKLKPGDQFPAERELSKQLNVSRNTLREVLKALKLLGVIETRQGNGTFINENLNAKLISTPFEFMAVTETNDILDLLEAREAIETSAAGIAAQRATEQDIALIRKNMQLMKNNIDNVELCSKYDVEFHFSICKASQNTFLFDLLKAIQTPLLRAMKKTYGFKNSLMRATVYHERIIESIIRKEPSEAIDSMREHLQEIKKDIQQNATQKNVTS